MSNQYSTNINVLFIPRVFANITEKRIRSVINDLNLGVIEKIDIKRKTTEKGENFNRVYVHLSSWYTNEQAFSARERLMEGKEIKIIYDEPWFWKVSAYRLMAGNTVGKSDNKKPFLSFDEEPRDQRCQREQRYQQEQPRYQQEQRYQREQPRYQGEQPRDQRYQREQPRYQREQEQTTAYFVQKHVQHTKNQIQKPCNRMRREEQEYVDPEYYTMTPPESITTITSEPTTPPYSPPPKDIEVPVLDYKNITYIKRKPLKVNTNKLDTFLSVLQPQDKENCEEVQ